MNSLDRCRRAASIVLVVASLILVPASAMAKFTATKTPAALSMATATMVMPTAVHGSFVCSGLGKDETITFSITSFTDAGPSGSTYTYTLLQAGAAKASGTSVTQLKTLTWTQGDDKIATTWSMTVQAKLANWTGPVSTTLFDCNKQSNNIGTF